MTLWVCPNWFDRHMTLNKEQKKTTAKPVRGLSENALLLNQNAFVVVTF